MSKRQWITATRIADGLGIEATLKIAVAHIIGLRFHTREETITILLPGGHRSVVKRTEDLLSQLMEAGIE